MTDRKRPPTTVIQFTKSSLGADFGGYQIATRPSRTPADDWTVVFDARVPAGRDPSHIEANHTRFHDVVAGWLTPNGGRWEHGHDWAMRAIDARTGQPGPWEIITTGVEVPRPALIDAWAVSNHAWWARCPIDSLEDDGLDVSYQELTFVYPTAGPDGEISVATRTRGEIPGRTARAEGFFFELTGADQLRWLLAAAGAGLPIALLRGNGDRYIGTVTITGHRDEPDGRVTGQLTVIETSRVVAPAECNLPCAVVLNGTNQWVEIADDPVLRPGTGPFTIILAGELAAAASKVALAKGNLSGADAFGFRTTSTPNQLEAVYGAETLAVTSAEWFGHDVCVALTFDGASTLTLYRDGTQVAQNAAATPGAVSSSAAITIGADNAGASGHMAARPYGLALYAASLDADAIEAAAGYLLGWPGYRMPPGALVFHDRRDQRAGPDTATNWQDLSGNDHDATLKGSPTIRGYAAPLRRLELY